MTLASDSYYMFLRWMKKLVRNPILLFFSLFQPIIFLVLFTQLFSSFGLLLCAISHHTGTCLWSGGFSCYRLHRIRPDPVHSGVLRPSLVRNLAGPRTQDQER